MSLGDPNREHRTVNAIDKCVASFRQVTEQLFCQICSGDLVIFASFEPQGLVSEKECFPTPTFQNILRSIASVLSIAQINTSVAIAPFLIKTLLIKWIFAAVSLTFYFELHLEK